MMMQPHFMPSSGNLLNRRGWGGILTVGRLLMVLDGRFELAAPRFMDAAQQRRVHQPAPERTDQRTIRPCPDADREDMNSPEELIAIRGWLQRPDQEGVDRRVPDLTDCLRRVNVQNGKRPIERTRLHNRLLAISLGEPRSKRPYLWLRRRSIPSKQTPQQPAEREEGTNRRAQRL